MTERQGALADVTVVELGEGWGAPVAGRILAELGARVIKVEPPAGDRLRRERILAADGQPYAIHFTSAGKRGIVLDPSAPGTARHVARLLEHADVLLADRSGLAFLDGAGAPWHGLEPRWPHLVSVALTPFGLTGRYAEAPASDLTVQAAAGILEATGFREEPPTRAGVPFGELTGATFAAVAALAGLHARATSGLGQRCDVSMRDTLIAYLTTHLPGYFIEGKPVERFGNRHPMVSPWNTYRAEDGWVIVCSGNDQHWQALLGLLGRTDLGEDPRYKTLAARLERVEEVDALIGAFTCERTIAEVVRAMDEARFPASPIFTIPEVLEDPHVRVREMVVERDGVRVVGSPLKLSETPARVGGLAPTLGRDTEAVLAEVEGASPRRPAPAGPPAASRGPLAGLKVLEVGAYTTAPYMCRFLANLGAEVTKVEPPGGEPIRRWPPLLDGDSYIAHLNNTDKRSVTLNLKHPRGRALLLDLARSHDVMIENFSRGAIDRLGLGAAAVQAANAGLVFCSLNGYGQYGPYADKPAFDMVIQATSGIMSLTGAAGGPPTRIGVSAMDCFGAFYGMIPILAAIHARRRTGRGQTIDVAMHDLGVWLTQEAWPDTLAGHPRPRLGNRHPHRSLHDIFRAADGWVAIDASEAAAGRALAALAGGDDAGRVSAWVAGRSREAVVAACHAAGVPAAPVLDVPAVVHDPLTVEREMLLERPWTRGRTIRLTGAPFRFSRTPAEVQRVLPAVGADTGEVLSGVGVGEAVLATLRAERVV